MSFGTWLTTDLYFSRETFNHRSEVESALKENTEELERAKADLTMLAFMTEPQKFCEKEESPEHYLREMLDYAIGALCEASIRDFMLTKLLDAWNDVHDKDGKAIKPPEGETKQYIDGDFIE